MLHAVLEALEELRTPFALYETDIHQLVQERLREADLPFVHEARIGSGCRIDYLIGGVGVEIKKGKPDVPRLLRQLERYAACAGIDSLIVLCSRTVSLPTQVLGKPLCLIVLNQLWGVALP